MIEYTAAYGLPPQEWHLSPAQTELQFDGAASCDSVSRIAQMQLLPFSTAAQRYLAAALSPVVQKVKHPCAELSEKIFLMDGPELKAALLRSK